jgi:hypothetical protein
MSTIYDGDIFEGNTVDKIRGKSSTAVQVKTEDTTDFPFKVNKDLLTIRKRREVQQRVAAVRKKEVALMDIIPMKEGESVIEWEIRSRVEAEERGIKLPSRETPKEGESVDAYLCRYYFDDEKQIALLFSLTEIIVEELCSGNKVVDPEQFLDLPTEAIMTFVQETLTKCGINVSALFSWVDWPDSALAGPI